MINKAGECIGMLFMGDQKFAGVRALGPRCVGFVLLEWEDGRRRMASRAGGWTVVT
jgi:hypothetical protein